MSDAGKYRLNEREHQTVFERDIAPDLFAGAKSVERPVAVIFGGQPGAGKSPALDAAVQELEGRGGAVQIIGDDLRAYHPRFAELMGTDDRTAAFYTDRDSGQWVEKAIAEAKARRVNVVIEGTMRDSAVVAKTMTDLRAAGYEIDARVLAVNPRLSEQGILQRYESQKATRGSGRMTTAEAHANAYEGLPKTVEQIEAGKLADRLAIYARGGVELYRNTLKNGHWDAAPGARQVLEREQQRPMSLEEHRAFVQGYDKLAGMVAEPSRQASAEELRRVAELRDQAHQGFKAALYRQEAPERAAREYPELAAAYGLARSIEAKAEAQGIQPAQKRAVMERVNENIAAALEKGQALPQPELVEARQVEKAQEPGLSR